MTLFEDSKSACAGSLMMAALVIRVVRLGSVSLCGNLVPSMTCVEDERGWRERVVRLFWPSRKSFSMVVVNFWRVNVCPPRTLE